MKAVALGVIALLLSASSGQNSNPPVQSPSGQAASSQARSADDRPTTSLPYTPSLDVTSMDKSVDPCADLYTYSCGGWMKKNPIPADQEQWSVYAKLYEDNQRFLWGILQDLGNRSTGRNSNQQKIGDYFGACMDEAAVEKAGLAPLEGRLQQISALRSKAEIPALLGQEHLLSPEGFFSASRGWPMFRFVSGQDLGNSEHVIGFARAGGLGLPDRDYYTKTDAGSEKIRNQYVDHVQKTMELLGDSPDKAKAEAAAIMRFETELAKASLTRVERRDPYKLYHKMTRQQLQALTPAFNWNAYLQAVGRPRDTEFNVTEPEFYKALNRQLVATSLEDLKAYLRWNALRADAEYLSSKPVQEDFDFYDRILHGSQQLRPRWKRCLAFIDRDLGEALGQEFVARAFTPEMKQRTVKMTREIESAMEDDIKELTWMSPETKVQALAKLHSIVNKVGYPDKWRDYSSVSIERGDFLGNVHRAIAFESRRTLAKIGKPLERGEWEMTPPTVNAYYNDQMNDINFPAGVLEPPLFDPKLDDAPNYGNTGGTIGHELTHGFDDEGSKFDAKGNLRNWWTKQDEAEFKRRTDCVANQYAQYTIVDNIKINSRLTLGEDVADLGGEVLAYVAWKAATKDQALKERDGFTPEQRFFIGYAQWACENDRPENLRVNAITNPHSPGKYRINGVAVNMPEFQQAFACKAGQPLVRENRCKVW